MGRATGKNTALSPQVTREFRRKMPKELLYQKLGVLLRNDPPEMERSKRAQRVLIDAASVVYINRPKRVTRSGGTIGVKVKPG
jgi:hypothetical protein